MQQEIQMSIIYIFAKIIISQTFEEIEFKKLKRDYRYLKRKKNYKYYINIHKV